MDATFGPTPPAGIDGSDGKTGIDGIFFVHEETFSATELPIERTASIGRPS
jgi:hypothetical protein